jgi:hypothetical protein
MKSTFSDTPSKLLTITIITFVVALRGELAPLYIFWGEIRSEDFVPIVISGGAILPFRFTMNILRLCERENN